MSASEREGALQAFDSVEIRSEIQRGPVLSSGIESYPKVP